MYSNIKWLSVRILGGDNRTLFASTRLVSLTPRQIIIKRHYNSSTTLCAVGGLRRQTSEKGFQTFCANI